jgi:hypothetical protein
MKLKTGKNRKVEAGKSREIQETENEVEVKSRKPFF